MRSPPTASQLSSARWLQLWMYSEMVSEGQQSSKPLRTNRRLYTKSSSIQISWAVLQRVNISKLHDWHFGHLADAFILIDIKWVVRRKTTIYRWRYRKDAHRNKCQAITIARLTHSLYTTKIARIRCYMMLSTIFKCQDVQHTIRWRLEQELSCFPHEEEPDPLDVVESKSAGSGRCVDLRGAE